MELDSRGSSLKACATRNFSCVMRCAEIDAARPVEPVRTCRSGTVEPALASIELGNQQQPPIRASVRVPSECRHLALQLPNAANARRASIHGESSSWVHIQYDNDTRTRQRTAISIAIPCWAVSPLSPHQTPKRTRKTNNTDQSNRR